jgi:hypothetical protein
MIRAVLVVLADKAGGAFGMLHFFTSGFHVGR